MSDLVGTPNCWFSHAQAHIRCDGIDSVRICVWHVSQCISERMQNRCLQEHALFRAKMFFCSFKVTNANIETKLEQMCCIHTRLVVCAQEHNDFSGGSP